MTRAYHCLIASLLRHRRLDCGRSRIGGRVVLSRAHVRPKPSPLPSPCRGRVVSGKPAFSYPNQPIVLCLYLSCFGDQSLYPSYIIESFRLMVTVWKSSKISRYPFGRHSFSLFFSRHQCEGDNDLRRRDPSDILSSSPSPFPFSLSHKAAHRIERLFLRVSSRSNSSNRAGLGHCVDRRTLCSLTTAGVESISFFSFVAQRERSTE